MWSDEKQRRLDDLRRPDREALDAEEQRELSQLLHELEQEEWIALRPGLDSLLREQQQLQSRLGERETQNAVLQALSERYADLLARAKAQLAALTHERDTLRAEYDRFVS
jgi:hypothetical protein